MRNLKKILALALVFAMAFTFTAGAAVDFTDKAEIGASYLDDVNMLVELGVIAGYPDGSFGPAKNITRAEFAKMAYTIKYGSDTDGNLFAAQKSAFTDVEGNANVAWAKGYINYCANQNIVSGVGAGKFNPQGNITVAEATKMLLVILGCDPAKEGFTGANWMANVVSKAIDLGIYNGWTGDPSQLATRELVAKLMRNTIFSSIYTYSAITGAGSQKDALGQNWNDTLGETTMGLKTVTGIVVANERYALSTDAEGNTLTRKGSVDLAINDGDYVANKNIGATGIDSEEAVILYETSNEDNDYYLATLTIDRALPDEMLGNKVNVFFKGDRIENNGRYDYKNVEVIGDVLVHSDTVVYNVDSINVDVYPNGTSSSAALVQPYIGFTVGGEELTIDTSLNDGVAKIEKSKNAQTDPTASSQISALINKYAYVLDASADFDTDGALIKATSANFISGMGIDGNGDANIDTYRFISVDGGNSYSYMIKFAEDGKNAGYGAVTAYNEAKGNIRISGIPGITNLDLTDVVLNDEVATGDVVVAYRENGKIVINKVDSMTGAVEGYGDDNSVIIGGETYYAWVGNKLDSNATLFNFYDNNKGALGASTKYYVYGNLIMEIDSDYEIVAAENYGVIIRSYYEQDTGIAYVTLAHADGTEGTYQIGKLHKEVSKETDKRNDRPQDFANNGFFGAIVEYKLRDDGTIDLSSQYFKDNDYLANYYGGTRVVGAYDNQGNYVVDATKTQETSLTVFDGQVEIEKTVTTNGIKGPKTTEHYYGLNKETLVFVIYGNPMYDNTGKSQMLDAAYTPIRARAYKLADFRETAAKAIDKLWVTGPNGGGIVNEPVFSVLFNTNTKNTTTTKYVVAAAMTVGADLGNITFKETESLAYVASARQNYNAATSEYFAQLRIIDENGGRDIDTVEGVVDLENNDVLSSSDGVGRIDGINGRIPAGSFIRYTMSADGKIAVLDNTDTLLEDVKTTFNSSKDGLYLVTVTGMRDEILTFFNADQTIKVENASATSCEFHEDGHSIINIDGDDYGEDYLVTLSSRETDLYANKGNAIVEVYEGQILRVFSFADGYTKVK